MKRTLSLILAFAMVLSLMVIPSFAAEVPQEVEVNGTLTPISEISEPTAAQYAEAYGYKTDGGDYTAGAQIIIDFDKELIYWADGERAQYFADDDAELDFAFFTTDGTKWSIMKFSIPESLADAVEAGPQKDFQKILDKGATSLEFATAVDSKTKAPQKFVKAVIEANPEDASNPTIISEEIPEAKHFKWGKINARPKLAGFKPDYAASSLKAVNATSLGEGGAGFWVPAQDKDPKQKADNLQIAYSADGKTPAGGAFGLIGYMYDVGGSGETELTAIPVLDYVDKPGKVTYLIRVAPTTTSAASKTKRIAASTVTKAPNIKVDYKKGIIKLKPDMVLGEVSLAYDSVAGEYIRTEVDDFDVIDGFPVTKKGDKLTTGGLKLVTTLTDPKTQVEYGVDYGVRTVGTAKKPASKVQPISIEEVSEVYEVDAALTIKNNSIKLPKGYEAVEWVSKDKADAKWKASIKAEKSGLYAVRLKNSAKYDAKTNTTKGNTQSGNLILDVLTGKNDRDKVIVAAATYVGDDGKGNNTASAARGISVYIPAADAAKTVTFDGGTDYDDVTDSFEALGADGYALTIVDGAALTTESGTAGFTWEIGALTLTVDTIEITEPTVFTASFETTKTADEGGEKFYAPTVNVTVAPDNKKIIAVAKTAIDSVTVTGTAGTRLQESDVKAALATQISAAEDAGCEVEIEFEEVTALEAGQTAGKYKYTFTITRGSESVTTGAKTVDVAHTDSI